jgi:hypothetical protein
MLTQTAILGLKSQNNNKLATGLNLVPGLTSPQNVFSQVLHAGTG